MTTPEDGSPKQATNLRIVEWLVLMHRFDDETLFDRLAAAGRLSEPEAETLADGIADFHCTAAAQPAWGGVRGMMETIATNRVCFEQLAGRPFDPPQTAQLNEQSLAWVDRLAGRLEERRTDGHVRRCHGDLHLGNICVVDGRPTLFDAIEFNDACACIDCLYDLAFLLMDLRAKGLPRLASVVLNRYMERTFDTAGLVLLPLYLSLRAAIRAHVSATIVRTTAAMQRAADGAPLLSAAQDYLDQALVYLAPSPPRLLAFGGLSGSGKSELAHEIAPKIGPAPGALVIRSDVVRKRLFDVRPEARLPASAYSEAATGRTYDRLYAEAERTLRDGHAVIADAVFALPEQRVAIESIARRVGVPFDGLWLSADHTLLRRRVAERHGDASDATPEIVDRQLGYDLGEIAWRRIDSGPTPALTAQHACDILGLSC
jgi:aminoglycoside phosphotransferase family enzyme/predicted kinase